MRRSEAPRRLNPLPGAAALMTLRVLLFFSVVFTAVAGAQQPDTAAKKPASSVASDTIFARARQLVLEGNGAQGRAIVDSVIAQTTVGTPGYAEALYWRALLAAAAADAERDYRRIIVEYPLSTRSGDALFSLSQLEMSRGDRDNAATHLERFMRDYPESPDRARAGLSLTRLLMDQGRVPRGCLTLGRARASVASDDVELKNQFDYYAQRCVGVDTVQAAVVRPAVPAVPTATDSARVASRRAPPQAARVDSAKTTAKTSVPPTTAPKTSAPPTTRAPAPPTTKPPTTSNTTYTIQVAAFDTKAEADQLADRLNTRGLTARVYGAAKPFRVRIGRFATQEAANDLLKQLRTQGVNGFVTVAEPGTK